MYCPQAAFKERFGTEELTRLIGMPGDPEAIPPVPDTTDGRTYTSAASDADAIIDGYIGARYTLPLASVPAFVVGIAADLTRYELYEEAPTKEVIERRKLAMDLLRDIRDGKLILPGGQSTASVPSLAVSASDPVFTPAVLDRFVGGL